MDAITNGRSAPRDGRPDTDTDATPPVSVVTIQRERLDHLRNLVEGVVAEARRRRRHDQLVVANMGGRSPELVLPSCPVDVEVDVVRLGEPGPDGLPLAAARNAGIDRARHDIVVLLDVDVVPAPGAIDAAARHVCAHPDAVALADVHYLPEDVPGSAPPARRAAAGRRHPDLAAPPADGWAVEPDHRLFWSTGFAARRQLLHDVGGFDEAFVGYGAEDTDLGYRLRREGVALHRVAGFVGHHQHHPTSSPPVQHMESIVRNALVFRERWGEWPMVGWLEAFAAGGLIEWNPDGDHLEQIDGARILATA